MNHRERVLNTLRGEATDRVARGEFFIADEFVREFLRLPADAPIEFQHHAAIVAQLDLDIASVSLSAGWGALEQPIEDDALNWIARWRAETDCFVFALMDGPFSAAIKARGFNELMHAILGAPHVARDLFRRGVDDARVIAQAARDAGAEGIVLGEDIAYGKTTYVSPNDLREIYLPYLRDAAREIRALGLTVFFHSDGNLNVILDDLVACELDGLQGLEPDAGMDIRAARARVDDTLTLWGNLGFDLLSAPRPAEELDTAIHAITSCGKIILGSCSGLVPGMNIEMVTRAHDPNRGFKRNFKQGD